MGPAELLDYDREQLRGLVLEEVGPTSHVAIVARALGIATVGQLDDIVALAEAGDAIIVDGDTGEVHLRPPADIETAYADKARFRARKQEQYRLVRDEPAVTRDGVEIALNINAGLLMDMPRLEESGAAGVGLFRTELQFMVASSFPRLERAGGLLSAGARRGQRQARHLPLARCRRRQGAPLFPPAEGGESGDGLAGDPARPRPSGVAPHAGARAAQGGGGARAAADVPDGHRGGGVRARQGDRDARAEPSRRATATGTRRHVALGTMIEVPSLLFQLDELFRVVDFASVGSNDLMQFVMASDRANSRLAGRFDPLNPAFLRALRSIARAADAAGKPLTLCGEIAGRPLDALGARGDRLPLALHGLGGDRAGEVGDPRARPEAARRARERAYRSGRVGVGDTRRAQGLGGNAQRSDLDESASSSRAS